MNGGATTGIAAGVSAPPAGVTEGIEGIIIIRSARLALISATGPERQGLMRPLATILLLLLLAGCAGWNWHDFGQSLLQSVCDSFEPCSVPCDSASGAC